MFIAGTLILTPNGPRRIEQIREGDYVLNSTSEWTPVLAVQCKPVCNLVEVTYFGQVLTTCSPITNFHAVGPFRRNLIKVKNIYTSKKVQFAKVHTDYGVNCDYAYMLGAMAGNGTCKRRGKKLLITCQDSLVPAAVAAELGVAWRRGSGKYDYIIEATKSYPLYEKWLKGRILDKKLVDLTDVATWNRKSQLKLLAGLIDTDGTVHTSQTRGKKDLRISFDNTSRSLVDAVKWLMAHLFQSTMSECVDIRETSTLPCYKVSIKKQAQVKYILRELTPYIHQTSKKWKPEYELLPELSAGASISFGKHISGVPGYALILPPKGNYVLSNGIVVDSAPMYAKEVVNQRSSEKAPASRSA